MDCPFCNINSQRTRIVKEDKNTFVILSNPCLMPGHLLVIPKRHIEKVSQLNEEERAEIFDNLIEFEEKILSKLSKGCDIRQHYKPFLPEGRTKVNHLHFHLHPRELEDELFTKVQKHDAEVWRDVTKDEIKRFVELYTL